MKISEVGLKLIKKFEGSSSSPYVCPAGVVTIGIGSTRYENGKKVKMSDPHISEKRMLEILKYQVKKIYGKAVKKYVEVELTQNQYDALVSFVYNIGAGAFKKSTLLRKLNKGDYFGASKEFKRWNRGGGKVLKGLVKRRKAEEELFLK